MVKFKLLFIALVAGLFSLKAQKPEWIDFNKRNFLFPKDQYLVGFYSANRNNDQPEDEQLKTLIEYAKADIIENISVSISSSSELNTKQIGKSFTQTFSQQSLASAKAELIGLKTQTHKEKKELFALAYVLRSDMIKYYNGKLSNLKSDIEQKYAVASQLKASNNKEGALDQYYQCLQQLVEANQSSAILLALQKHNSENQLSDIEAKVRADIQTIIKSAASDPEEASLIIAEALNSQIKENKKTIKISALTFQDSKMASQFSAYFTRTMESKLLYRNFEVDLNGSNNAKYILHGTYWEESDKLRIVVMLNDIESGKVIATSETYIPKDWFSKNQYSILPENFHEASIRQQIFKKDEIINGGLHIDLWTNKGDDNLIFFEDDPLKLFVRVNHECYLRFVYYMADGSKVLLMDDYYISSDQVNKPVEIPETFTCSAPFGVENLQLNAQTTPFEPLNATMNDGYKFIQDDNATIQVKTRGFKKAENNILKAEKRLTITTMRKI